MIQGYAIPNATMLGNNGAYKSEFYKALEGAKAAGATVEDAPCLLARGVNAYNAGLPNTPSLLIVPQFYKAGNLYQDVPPFVAEDSTMRFTVSRNTTATRVDSSGLIESVASGVPRIDWLGQSCPALLVEPSAQNLVLQSAFATGWSLGGSATVSANTSGTLSPENLNTAARLNVVTSAFSSTFRTFTSVSGTVYTTSVFAKKDTKDWIYFVNLTGSAARVWFNLASGTIGTIGSGISNVAIQNYGNGWYRCSWTETAGGTTSYFQVGASDVDNSNTPTSSGSVYIWGAQLETGSVATTYIPTTTGAGSRAADTIIASGALVSSLIGQTEGTIYAEFTNTLVASYVESYMYRVFADANNEIWARKEGGTNTYSFRWRANSQNTTFLNVAVPNGVNKIAFGYKSGDTALFLNGSQVATTNTDVRAFSVNPTTIALGSTSSGQFFNDRIRAAAIYTTRLSNDQLANITRLT